MKDAQGITIVKGDTVAVAGRRGSSIWINTREVTDTSPHKVMLKNEKGVDRMYMGGPDGILVIKPVISREIASSYERDAIDAG